MSEIHPMSKRVGSTHQENNLASKQWRMENLYLIKTEAARMVPLKLRGEQREFLENRHSRNFVPKARKLGMSTIIVLSYLDDCLFPPTDFHPDVDDEGQSAGFEVGHVDLSETSAFKKLEIARFAWENGPNHPNLAIAALWKVMHQQNPRIKDSAGEMTWTNGSKQVAGVKFTGSTPQRLHISEYGPISAAHPAKSADIRRGSINAVPPDGICDIETTMEGGRFGECYAIFKMALDACGSDLTKMDWKLHFFSWLNHPSYDLPGHKPSRADTFEYFDKLKREHGITTSESKKAWWEYKRKEQGEDMWQQFPSIVEECDRHVVAGQIYPEITGVRARGQVLEFEPERDAPLFSCWDIGSGANAAGWLLQTKGPITNWIDWCAGEGRGAPGMASAIRAFEAKHGPIEAHLLPHDGDYTDKGSGKTFIDQLVEAGIPRGKVKIVPRIKKVGVGIEELRKYLPNSWYHKRCDVEQMSSEGAPIPSGVGRMEGYRRKIISSTGITTAVPVGDICSHTADAARTYAEARAANLLDGITTGMSDIDHRRSRPKVKTGYRGRN